MSLLTSMMAGDSNSRPAPHDDFWYGDAGMRTSSGQIVTSDGAMRLSAVWSCVRALSESIGTLPLVTYERLTRGKQRAFAHPLYQVLHIQPNRHQTAAEWTEMIIGHLALRGNAYCFIDLADGIELIPLHPDRVLPSMDTEINRIVYKYTRADGKAEVYLDEQILHIKMLSLDGVIGLNPIAYQRETLGISLAAEDYGARFFANDATPTSVIEHPTHFKDDEARGRFRRSWQQSQSGSNRHKTAVLEDGLKIKQLGLTNEDAQFLETRKFQLAEIARIFRVPLHMIEELDNATFSNIEHRSLEFVIFTLTPYLRKIEQAITTKLITRPDQYLVEYLVDGLLRGDQKARYDAYHTSITDGWLTRNEAREKENLNPLPGLDEPLVPLNMGRGAPSRDRAEAKGVDRAARKEVIAVSEAYSARAMHDFNTWAQEYYTKLPRYLREAVGLDAAIAEAYCTESLAQLSAAQDVPALLADWSMNKSATLAQLQEFAPCNT